MYNFYKNLGTVRPDNTFEKIFLIVILTLLFIEFYTIPYFVTFIKI